ncbi:MAG: transcription antitermination factor NusB [Elusimicrobia bacterium]|nr:transcription antitermination factor NusB [Elusimicrobiota bacterium]
MGRRRQARENALHSLYLFESGLREDAAFRAVNEEVEDAATLEFSRRLFKGTLLHRDALDRRIAEIARNWDVSRMAAVDRNVLRMAAFELIHCPDTPPGVVINEAIEIVRRFSTEDSTRFVNGILDRIRQEWLESPAP